MIMQVHMTGIEKPCCRSLEKPVDWALSFGSIAPRASLRNRKDTRVHMGVYMTLFRIAHEFGIDL